MGCDIHVHVEVKIGGAWRHYNHPWVKRDYDLFAKMADVRNRGTIEPIAGSRGLPEDVSFTTKFDAEDLGVDGHSHSFLSVEEIAKLAEWCEERHDEACWFENTFGFLFGNSLGGFLKYPKDYPKEVEDVRLVFWFDN